MLFGPNIQYFNELEINGENVDDDDNEDYTADQLDVNDENDAETSDTDDLTDFTAEEFDADNEESEESTEDTASTDDNNDEGEEDDTPTEDAGGEETSNEEDDLTDFTAEEFDAEDDSESDNSSDSEDDTGDDEGSEGTGEEESSDNTEDSGSVDSNNSDNTLVGMEKNLFSDLSPQQLAIKNNELLQNYIELYETTNTIFDSINKIPKTFDNTRPLTFIADKLVELKDMVNYIITTTYVTRTYVENMVYYKQALVVLEQLNSMLKALVQKPAKS